MVDSRVPLDVAELLDRSIDSLAALEALLLLLDDASRWWAVPEVAHGIGVDTEAADHALSSLRAGGLADGPRSARLFRLSTHPPVPHAVLLALAMLYASDREAVVDRVTRRALGRLRVLADAFTRGRGV